MILSAEIIAQLIPEGFPSTATDWDKAMADRIYSQEENEDQDQLVRSFLWAQAITHAWLATDLRVPFETASSFSSGFVSLPKQLQIMTLPRQITEFERFVFGAQILVRPAEVVEEMPFVEVDERMFPIVPCFGEIDYHGIPPSPNQQGSSWTSTCWAESTGSHATWSQGIVTCRHGFVTLRKGERVSLTPTSSHAVPTRAEIADFDNSTIDAAILEFDKKDWPNSNSLLTCTSAIAPGSRVQFETSGGRKTSNVLRTFLNPSYFGNMLGQRIVTDRTGNPGDSGTLLREDKASPDGLGIYMGVIPDGSGGTEGIFQSLEQAKAYFKLDLYL